jgi:hypothetical protein
MRRVKAGFAMNRHASGPEIKTLYSFGLKQLDKPLLDYTVEPFPYINF